MPVIADFFAFLESKATPTARWHKVDLHNHSPASHDFGGNRATAVADFTQRIRDERISAVMFTDHEKLPDADFVRSVAKQSGALVISGLEVNVFIDAFGKPADKVGKEICFHLLIGFDPESQPSQQYWVEHLYTKCRAHERDFGGTTVKGIAATMDQIHEVLKGSGALLIPAHLHTRGDAFRSRSVDDVISEPEFLRWTREFFTALDVRKDATAAYFDGKHAETEFIEKTCIRSSDAHDASQLGTTPTWVQMEKVSFAELKAALELPSRVSRNQPDEPSSYVIGLHVEGHYLTDLWMMLSPHLNVLIGVKGAGKTSILECLRFGLGNEVPHDRQEEVNKHLNAILGPAGRVRLLLKRDDGGRVLVERGVADKKFRVTFEDDREVFFDSAEPIRFPSVVLGWHEIEHAATDRQIRRLQMDAISGRATVHAFTQQAKSLALAIQQQHEFAAAKHSQYVQLSDTVARQEEMRQGLQQLNEANLIDMRDQMSNALATRAEIQRLRDHLASLPEHLAIRVSAVLQIDQFKLEGVPPLADIAEKIASDVADLKCFGDEFAGQALLKSQQKLESVQAALLEAQVNFDRFSEDYRARLSALPPEVQRLLESHRDVLEKTRELPTLKSRLEELTKDIDVALAILAETCEKVAQCLDDRLALRTEKVKAFGQQLAEAGVTLQVVAGTAREDEFTSIFSQFGPSRDVFAASRESFRR